MSQSKFVESKENFRSVEELDETPVSDMTVPEIRLSIGRIAGLKTNPESRFGKKELNSIHAFLTGEWVYEPRHYGTPLSKDVNFVRMRVAMKAGISEYLPHPDDPPDHDTHRPFRQSELVSLRDELKKSEDKRPTP